MTTRPYLVRLHCSVRHDARMTIMAESPIEAWAKAQDHIDAMRASQPEKLSDTRLDLSYYPQPETPWT